MLSIKKSISVNNIAKELPNRFVCWSTMGSITREPRTNTQKELMDSLSIKLLHWEKRCKAPEQGLIDKALSCGVDLLEEAENAGVDLFEAARRLGNKLTRSEKEMRELPDLLKKARSRGIIFFSPRQSIDFKREAEIARNQKSIYEHNLLGLQEFVSQMNDMPSRHLSVAHDIIDIDSTCSLAAPSIFPETNWNFLLLENNTNEQKSFLQYVLERLPKLSKENPALLNLFDKIIACSDIANIKYFIKKCSKVLPDLTPFGKHLEAAEELVPDFAERILSGSPSMSLDSNCKENLFYNYLMSMINHYSKPENIKLLKKALDIMDKINDSIKCHVNISRIIKGDTEVINDNTEVLHQVLQNAYDQGIREFDVSEFLTHNVNLK